MRGSRSAGSTCDRVQLLSRACTLPAGPPSASGPEFGVALTCAVMSAPLYAAAPCAGAIAGAGASSLRPGSTTHITISPVKAVQPPKAVEQPIWGNSAVSCPTACCPLNGALTCE